MSKFGVMCLALGAIALLTQNELIAQTTADFGAAEFAAQATKIQNFLFGPAMRIAGIMGGAYGLIQAILNSTIKPLIIYGGLGLAVNLIPTYINSVFSVAGMLLQ